MAEMRALFLSRVIPILTVPHPGGGRVAKLCFVGKGGLASNQRPDPTR